MSAPTAGDSLPTPLSILQRFYAAEKTYMSAPPESRDFSLMAAVLSPDMKLHQSPDLLWGGEYTGHEGFLKWAEAAASSVDGIEALNPEIFENPTNNKVVVSVTVKGRARNSEEEREMPMVQVVEVDREKGVIKDIRVFNWNVTEINEALKKSG